MMKTQFYPFGASQAWMDQRDDELAAADVPQTVALPGVIDSATYETMIRTITQLRRQVEDLAEENEILRAQQSAQKKPRKPAEKKSNRGRMKLPPVRTIRGAKFYSEAHVAEILKVNQSTVGRRAAHNGVVADTSEGGKYYPASQLDNLRERKRQP